MTCVSLLTYPCEVDCAGQNVDIHEVVDDPTLYVTCNRNRHELKQASCFCTSVIWTSMSFHLNNN